MIDFLNYFTPKTVAANWTEVASNSIPYLGSGLFPSKKKKGLSLRWIVGNKGLPVSLMPSAFDAKATFQDREKFKISETEMPFFREGRKIKERDMQEIMEIENSNDPDWNEILTRLFDDTNDLIKSANVVPERMRMSLLFPEDGKPKVSIKANGVDYSYEYDSDGEWKQNNYFALTGDQLWTAKTTADPFLAFRTAKDAIRSRTGTDLSIAIMNSYTFNLFAGLDAVKNRYLTTTGRAFSYLTESEVVNVLNDVTGLSLIVYDKLYKDEDRTEQKFVPDGFVSIVPSGPLGNTWYGTTPEERTLRGVAAADVSIVETGVAITQITTDHPVNIDTFASEIVLPSYERMGEVALLKVIS